MQDPEANVRDQESAETHFLQWFRTTRARARSGPAPSALVVYYDTVFKFW